MENSIPIHIEANVNSVAKTNMGNLNMSISKGIRTICIGDRTFYGCRILSFDNDHEYNWLK
mgnify:CR=1 FL=1